MAPIRENCYCISPVGDKSDAVEITGRLNFGEGQSVRLKE